MAVRVRVRYFHLVREITGGSAEEVVLEAGATLGELLEALRAAHGPRFSEFLWSGNQGINPHVRLFLNDKALVNLDPGQVLADGDTLLIFSAVAGG